MNLRNQAALVTGGSRGLGAALGRRLAEEGATVVLVARDSDAVERVARDIRARGGKAFGLAGDVSDKNAAHPIAFSAAALAGPLDLLVHNASTLGPTPLRLLLDTECEDFADVLEVNLVGPFRLSKIVGGAMALRGHGTIVHVTSDASVSAYATWGAYSVSKAAQDHLARLWAAELGEHGVRSFSVDPGEMDTRMHADAVPDADRTTLAHPDVVAARIVAMIRSPDVENGARLEVPRWKAAS